MAAYRYWRLVGFCVSGNGPLELSEARLYSAGVAVDVSAIVTCPFAPASGTLADLKDGLATGVVSWSRASHSSSGFALTWDLTGAGASVDAIRLGSGASAATFPATFTLQWSADNLDWKTFGFADNVLYPGAASQTPLPTTGIGDPHYSNVVLLMHCDGLNGARLAPDVTRTQAEPTLLGDTQISTAKSRFGGASLVFDGGGDYLLFPRTPVFNLLFEDFTLEFFCLSTTFSNVPHFFQLYGSSVNYRICLYAAGGMLRFYTQNGLGTGGDRITTPAALAANVWHHVAVTRSSGTFTMYLNGIKQGTSTTTVLPNMDLGLSLGFQNYEGFPNDYLNGNIDEVRITRGVSRYSANFTPPAQVFANDWFGISSADFLQRFSGNEAAQIRRYVGSVLPDGAAITHSSTHTFFDAYNGGLGTITGTVKEKNTPANTPLRRRVLLIDEASRMTIRETWSDPATGAFEFRGVKQGVKYTVISYDHLHNYRAVIADNQDAT